MVTSNRNPPRFIQVKENGIQSQPRKGTMGTMEELRSEQVELCERTHLEAAQLPLAPHLKETACLLGTSHILSALLSLQPLL